MYNENGDGDLTENMTEAIGTANCHRVPQFGNQSPTHHEQ